MGFFSKLLGGKSSKTDLIKKLAKERLRRDPMAWEYIGCPPDPAINKLSSMEINSLPEAAIVAIVETYSKLKSMGVPESEILSRIEAHRAQFRAGIIPSPLTLLSYTKYRLALEYTAAERGPLSPISDNIIEEAIKEALQFFS